MGKRRVLPQDGDGDGDGLRTPAAARALGTRPSPRSLSGGWEALSWDGQGLTGGRFGDHPLPAAPYPGTYKNNLAPRCRLCLQL